VRYYLRLDVLPAVVRIAIDALRDVLTRGVAKPLAEVFMGSATCPCSVIGAAASTSRSDRVAAFQALLGSDIKQMMEDVGAQRTSVRVPSVMQEPRVVDPWGCPMVMLLRSRDQ